ncbi:hypothetical protein O4H49_05870 [Kiloniella laminariae]|uniref:Uncharacterized protein n=1 Tax=Kiloniella laminariae TaxID=454162 RepID=A0ABT4LGR1_9PROT|nr:hypothetical protein [Kiloniella laminariae]MCZ4280294.1 hypothetical protein [Kiloniella laminariae]
MPLLHWFATGFLLPGDLVIKKLDISLEEDGGILRSFVNMCFWGIVVGLFALGIY